MAAKNLASLTLIYKNYQQKLAQGNETVFQQQSKLDMWTEKVHLIEKKAQEMEISLEELDIRKKHHDDSGHPYGGSDTYIPHHLTLDKKEQLIRQKTILEQSYMVNKKMMVNDLQNKKKECESLRFERGQQRATYTDKSEELHKKQIELLALLKQAGKSDPALEKEIQDYDIVKKQAEELAKGDDQQKITIKDKSQPVVDPKKTDVAKQLPADNKQAKVEEKKVADSKPVAKDNTLPTTKTDPAAKANEKAPAVDTKKVEEKKAADTKPVAKDPTVLPTTKTDPAAKANDKAPVADTKKVEETKKAAADTKPVAKDNTLPTTKTEPAGKATEKAPAVDTKKVEEVKKGAADTKKVEEVKKTADAKPDVKKIEETKKTEEVKAGDKKLPAEKKADVSPTKVDTKVAANTKPVVKEEAKVNPQSGKDAPPTTNTTKVAPQQQVQATKVVTKTDANATPVVQNTTQATANSKPAA